MDQRFESERERDGWAVGFLSGKIDHLAHLITTMSQAISDYAAKQTAFNTQVSNDLDAIQTAVTGLNALITTLQNSNGAITPEDQATLDQLQTAGNALQTKADSASAADAPVIPPAVVAAASAAKV